MGIDTFNTSTKKIGEGVVSRLTKFSPPSMLSEQDDAIVKRLYEKGVHPTEGLEMEVAFTSGDQIKVSILFNSMEAFRAFDERIGPIITEMGLDPG